MRSFEGWRLTGILQHYRSYIIFRCPSVRFLDFQKVKEAERKQAQELFGTVSEPSGLASQIMGVKTRTFDVAAAGDAAARPKNYRVKLTDKERRKVEELVRNAKSLQEIIRLEKELNEGRVPAAAQGADEMEQD